MNNNIGKENKIKIENTNYNEYNSYINLNKLDDDEMFVENNNKSSKSEPNYNQIN